MGKKESTFSGELKKSCEELGIFYYKIPDAYGMARFAPQKPFDAIMIHKGKVYCIENKIQTKKSAFALNRIKPHQIEGLQRAQNSGAISYILINYRFKGFNKILVLNLGILNILIKETKSIKIKDLDVFDFAERIKYNNKTIWDIKKICSIN